MFLLQNKRVVYLYRQTGDVGKHGYNEYEYRAYQYLILVIDTVVLCYINAPLPKIVIGESYQDYL